MSTFIAAVAVLVITQAPTTPPPPPEDDAAEDVVTIGAPTAPQEEDSGLPWHLPPEQPPAPIVAPDLFASIYSLQFRGLAGNYSGGLLALQTEFSFGKAIIGVVGLAPPEILSSDPLFGLLIGVGLGGNIGWTVYRANKVAISILGPEWELGGILQPVDAAPVVMWADVGISGIRAVFCPFKVDVRPHLNLYGGGISVDVAYMGWGDKGHPGTGTSGTVLGSRATPVGALACRAR